MMTEEVIQVAMELGQSLRYLDCRCCEGRWQFCPLPVIKRWDGMELVPDQYMARITTRNRLNGRMIIVCSHSTPA